MGRPSIYGSPMTGAERVRRHRARQMEKKMAMSRIELRWAGVAAGVMPRAPGMIGGPTPDELGAALHTLRSLQAGAPHEWAVAPLVILMCSVYLQQDEAQAVADGSERLRELGLNDLSVRGDAARGTPGEAEEYLGRAPSDEMVLVLDSRIRDERPPVPSFVAPASTVTDVQTTFGSPDADALDALGAMGLTLRIDELEARMELAQQRMDWVTSYMYPPSHLLEERGTWQALSTRRRDALAAFERSDIPQTWSAPECPRRLFQRISIGAPTLAADMMSRVPAVTITEPPKPGELLDTFG